MLHAFLCSALFIWSGSPRPQDTPGQDYRGSITGAIVDASSREPLPGVNVVVVQMPGSGTGTDSRGVFRLENLPVGTYSLRVSAVGYEPRIITNVVVATGRTTPVHAALDERPVEAGEVTVQADYFSRAEQMSPLSASSLDRSEIRRSPGGIQDVQRVVQNLPGVASSTDNINELIVRGGAPFENLTIMDQMELPSINHYSNQFNSAGPINMVNADMIQDVQFSAGGFPARYGDKTSSVMDLTVREGSRSAALAGTAFFNMAGAGALLEGGIGEGRGSFIVSGRKSSLEVIDAVVGLSALSLTAIPRYWDSQGKAVLDLDVSNRLKLGYLYGESRISVEGDPKEEDGQRKNVTDSAGVLRIYPFNRLYAVGLTWQNLRGRTGYGTLTLYSVGSTYRVEGYEDYTRQVRGSRGEVLDYTTLVSRPVFTNDSYESYLALKAEAVLAPRRNHELSVGAQIQTAQAWRNTVTSIGDTSRYDLDGDGVHETGPVLIPGYDYTNRMRFGQSSKYFLYASDRIGILPGVSLTGGLRYDHFTYSGRGLLAPRFSLSWSPGGSTYTIAAGRYAQTHPLPFYSDRTMSGVNQDLPHMFADHLVAGYQQVLGEGLKLSIEAYAKWYHDVAVSEDFVYSAIDTFWSERNLAGGTRRSYGGEFFLEQKQVEDVFGTLSLSLQESRDADPRLPPLTSWYPSDYDYTVILTAVGGYVLRGARDWLDEAPFFLRYPSYLLCLSNEIELSVRYRYQSGRVHTPRAFVRWKQEREGGIAWSQGAWVDTDEINGGRYPAYSRLDLQWYSRFYFTGWNINVYIALQNLLNTRNVFFENHRSDGTIETVYQFSFFPVAGVEAEF
ncbi:MAG: TonB-dependent receptor [Bacteroidota bacterium]